MLLLLIFGSRSADVFGRIESSAESLIMIFLVSGFIDRAIPLHVREGGQTWPRQQQKQQRRKGEHRKGKETAEGAVTPRFDHFLASLLIVPPDVTANIRNISVCSSSLLPRGRRGREEGRKAREEGGEEGRTREEEGGEREGKKVRATAANSQGDSF